ncbi:hypothetical protein H2198_005051 [Neophaeococcomyces mojaviensis]|uniref:Uncharacterized protein n=1 Tax=Neophaeococcomyces mojaviensis TaxID=3383035 RepID=A0ACC3A791_9EURO|nr:hypothetical protein H2198_005051 [Knufia sp. JES_112]
MSDMPLGTGVSFDVSSLVADWGGQFRVPTGLLPLASVNSLGEVLQDQRQYKEAEELYRQALAGRKKMLVEDDPDTLASVNDWKICSSGNGASNSCSTVACFTVHLPEPVPSSADSSK